MKPKTNSLASILFRHTASLTGAAFVFSSGTAMADTTLDAPLVLTTPADLGTITRTADGATLTLTGEGYTTSNTDTNGILGGWAVINNGTTYDWAHNDGAAIAAAVPVTLGTSFSGDFSTINWTNTDGNTALTAATQVNSYVGASDVTISGALTIGSGGMILGNTGSKWIANGTGGQITTGLASGELFVYTPNTAATDMRIRVPLVDNGAIPLDLVKDGAGRLDLESANTYTGATILNQGILYLRTNTSLGSTSGIVVNGNSGITVSTNVDYGGLITGSGTFNNGAFTGNASFAIFGDLSGFSGTLAHTTSNGHNNLNLGGGTAASMDASQAKMVLSGSTNQARNVNINGTGDPLFKLGDLSGTGGKINVNNGTTLQVGALGLDSPFAGNISSNGSLEKVGAGTLTLSGPNSYSGATTITGGTLEIGNGSNGSIAAGSTVTVGAAGTLAFNLPAAATFPNSIVVNGALTNASGNDLILSGPIDGAGSIVKDDFGTLTVSGSGFFSGTATVTEGALKVTGFNDNAAVTLGAGTLTGSGSVGAVTVNDTAAILSNGNADNDDLEAASLTFSSAGTINLNKSADPATPSVQVTGNLTSTTGITVNVTSAPTWISGQTYNLIGYGSFTGSAAHFVKGTIPGLGARQSATIGSTGATNGYITLAISGVSPYWTGAQNTNWTTSTITGLKNWALPTTPTPTPTDFVTNDLVLFDDSATGTTVNISNADVQVAGVIFNNTTKNYTIGSTGGFGIIEGATPASLTKSGTGTVALATMNDYTGATIINDGTLQLGDGTTDGDIESSSGITNDGTLIFNRVANGFFFTNAISGSGEVIKNGPGTQILSGANSYSGGTTINAGTLEVGDFGTTGSLGSGLVTNNASLVFTRSNAAIQGTDFGTIEGTGSVTQDGFGTLTLSAANTYSGGTTINAGSVIIGANNPLGTSPVTLAGGTLSGSNVDNYGLANALIAQADTFSMLSTMGKNLDLPGNLSGSGDILRTATGSPATIYLSGDNSGFTGTFTVDANGSAATRFTAPSAGSAAGKWVIDQSVNSRASLDFGGGTIQFGSFTGTGFFSSHGLGVNTIEVGNLGMDDTFSGVLNQGAGSTLAVTKVGAGTWTLTGANTYTGDTTVMAGILAVDGDSLADANKLVINGGKVDPMGGTEVVGTLYFGATQQAAGTWGATDSGADHIDDVHFTGTGVVSVTTGPSSGYSDWADLYAPGQAMDQDHDNDGVDNGIEYFMGETGSTFTANPAPNGGAVTWSMAGTYTGVYGTDYEVQTSSDLVNWTQVPIGTGDNTVAVTAGPSVVYDMPTGGKSFVRLVVRN